MYSDKQGIIKSTKENAQMHHSLKNEQSQSCNVLKIYLIFNTHWCHFVAEIIKKQYKCE